MTRETKVIELTDCKVTVNSYLKWGEKNEIEQALIKGAEISDKGLKGFDTAVLTEQKYKICELVIVEIDTKGVKTKFTREWLNDLRAEDGDDLLEQIDELNKKKQ